MREMKASKGGQHGDVATGQHKQVTEARLILGGFALLLVVGGGLTAIFMGSGIAALAIVVIGLSTGLLVLIYMALGYLERWLKQ